MPVGSLEDGGYFLGGQRKSNRFGQKNLSGSVITVAAQVLGCGGKIIRADDAGEFCNN
jgi:hypothetical protein